VLLQGVLLPHWHTKQDSNCWQAPHLRQQQQQHLQEASLVVLFCLGQLQVTLLQPAAVLLLLLLQVTKLRLQSQVLVSWHWLSHDRHQQQQQQQMQMMSCALLSMMGQTCQL
jgi:hypothetical protein